MKRVWITCLLLICVAGKANAAEVVPFPDVEESSIDPQIARLVRYRIQRHTDAEGAKAEKKIVAMGTNAVPTLIAMAKLAANNDSLVLEKEEVQDYDWELRRPLQMLVKIGDRRAIPIISALVKYDTKPRRMTSKLEELLCHGSDQQIKLDALSEDPNVTRAANRILEEPDQFSYYKKLYRKKAAISRSP